MGFTIEDMMLVSRKKYDMKYLAGKNGWSNSISWVHLLEDTTIIQNFWGKELAVTTGLGFSDLEHWMNLAKELVRCHAAGLIVNTGKYIHELPEELMHYCDDNDLPLLTVPWEVLLADMIKDFSIRIFMQESADEQIASALVAAIEEPDNQEKYRKELLQYFDVDGRFQVILITCEGLDAMDTVERKKLSYRIQMYLEEVTHNASLFYYNGSFVLVMNALSEKSIMKLLEGMIRRAGKRMPGNTFRVGIGSARMDISKLSVSYQRARAAVKIAFQQNRQIVRFDECGVNRLLYMIADPDILREFEWETLKELEEYDKNHHGNYVETLRVYLESDGSIQMVAKKMFTHRNTVLYRIGNIRKILNSNLDTPQERMPYQLAFYIRDMHKN